MKNIFSSSRFSYSFTPRIHGNVLAWVKPASRSERTKRVIENILRWEDDGGPVAETVNPLPHRPETNTSRVMDAEAEHG